MTQNVLFTYESTQQEIAKRLRLENRETEQVLNALADRSDRVLFRTTAFFPLDLFPDELIIDEMKVTIINRSFFSAEQVYTIGFASIIDVTIETAPLFATLNIRDKGWGTVISIRYLPKDDALRALKILQGILILQSKNLDIGSLSTKSTLNKVESIGHSHHDQDFEDKLVKSRLPS